MVDRDAVLRLIKRKKLPSNALLELNENADLAFEVLMERARMGGDDTEVVNSIYVLFGMTRYWPSRMHAVVNLLKELIQQTNVAAKSAALIGLGQSLCLQSVTTPPFTAAQFDEIEELIRAAAPITKVAAEYRDRLLGLG